MGLGALTKHVQTQYFPDFVRNKIAGGLQYILGINLSPKRMDSTPETPLYLHVKFEHFPIDLHAFAQNKVPWFIMICVHVAHALYCVL